MTIRVEWEKRAQRDREDIFLYLNREAGDEVAIAADDRLAGMTGSRTERDINRFLSLYLDGPAGLTDSSLLAASEILRMRDVPPEFIAWLENVRKEMEEPCECPECCAERAKHPQLH
ncbi:TPA: hypothetical protein R4H36_004538 [Salmonella enterica subsp. enterica serovar Newport]|nr:hypothetical protein [Salmonella enterica subsp. enterica serovar Newport]